MKNQLLKISLKFGLILGVINLLFMLVINSMPNQQNHYVIGFFNWTLFIIPIVIAHYEFNKKNGNFISFKDAILIGLIVLGISNILSTVYYSLIPTINFPLFIRFIIIQKLFSQIIMLFLIITVESLWKIYTKAGKNGLASVVPVYNIIILLEIVKKPTWWLILLLIPFVNIIFAIWVTNLISKKFGKSEGFTIGLIFLPFIFYPILGMSRIEYIDE